MVPPRLPTWLLNHFGHPDTREEVQGDLLELYNHWVETVGVRKANWRYALSALKLLRPLAKSNEQYTTTTFSLNPDMIRNYLTVAWRNLIRNKAFSAINLSGLALGMTCSLLILLWVQDERSVDGFHANGKHLYQVYVRQHYEGKIEGNYFTPGLLADELKKVIPEVQYASSLEGNNRSTFQVGNRIDKMEGTYAGADFFKMFSYPLLQGTAEVSLSTPTGIAISRRMAEQFFGSPEKAIGKSIRFETKMDLTVVAVFENIPANSSVQFDYLRPWVDFVKENEWTKKWGNNNPAAFVQLRPGRDGRPIDPATVEAKIKDFYYRYMPKEKTYFSELGLQPYSEKYLHSTFKNGEIDGGRIEYVRLLSLVAVFILLIACINFMNLATARSTKRAKEVGVRKAVGATRSALMGQFVGEAMLLTFLAMLMAVMLVALLIPAFNQLTGKHVSLPVEQPLFWVALVGFLLITGLVAGSYPAFFLSSLKPVRVLKGSLRFSASALFFRKGLVVFQFGLSILLIVGTIVIYRQMDFVQTQNLGYDRENLVYIPIEGDLVKEYDLFKERLSKTAGILSTSQMGESPTGLGHHINDVGWPGKDPNLRVVFSNTAVHYDFVKTLNLKLREGRDFSKTFGTDSLSFIINETALAKIGYKNPIGQPLSWGGRNGHIIGVVRDFHFNSMRQAIEPLIIRLNQQPRWGTILVRTEAGKTKQALASLEQICKELNPNVPFTYQFSDQEYEKLYKSEQVVSQLANYFAFLAIFISCLGLFGLAAFTAEQRTKEIGVRKVLGASVASVVTLLSKDFLKLVLIAIVIASPVAWYAMHTWLQNFAYQIDLSWWIFALAGVVAVAIALLTVSFQSIKAALMNPVTSLRSE